MEKIKKTEEQFDDISGKDIVQLKEDIFNLDIEGQLLLGQRNNMGKAKWKKKHKKYCIKYKKIMEHYLHKYTYNRTMIELVDINMIAWERKKEIYPDFKTPPKDLEEMNKILKYQNSYEDLLSLLKDMIVEIQIKYVLLI